MVLTSFVCVIATSKIAENKPCEVLILFSETDGSKYLLPKCQEMKKTMEDMEEATLPGQFSKSPANKRRRNASQTHKSLADIRGKQIQLLNGRIETLQTHKTSFFHYLSMVIPDVSYDEMEGDVELFGRDEDLDVEGQNDDNDYDDSFVYDPDMEHRNVEGASDDD
ncbi:hypothetical protein MKW92_036128 [Papaver armeniacum]|nr:hypothetical protein MKW92_036128 [Papaver armeniacum]